MRVVLTLLAFALVITANWQLTAARLERVLADEREHHARVEDMLRRYQ